MLILLWLFWPAGLIWYLVDESMKSISWVKYQFKQWLGAVIVVIVGMFASAILMLVLIGIITYVLIAILGLVWFIQGIIFAVQRAEKPLWLIGNKVNEKLTF